MPTFRYVVNPEAMNIALVDKPAHIGIRDSLTGYGDRCWIVECGGVDIDAGLDAIRAVYPEIRVLGDIGQALAAFRRDGEA